MKTICLCDFSIFPDPGEIIICEACGKSHKFDPESYNPYTNLNSDKMKEMDNSKKTTPEEMLKPKAFDTICASPVVYFDAAVNVVKQYAAQEVTEKDAEIERLKSESAEYTIRSINDQAKLRHVILEKNALLKEAIDKGEKLYNALMSIHLQFGDESHAFQMSNELYHWCEFMHSNKLKTPGTEGGTHGKDEL